MVLQVIINGLSLGHFDIFMHSVLGVNGVQLRLGEVMNNPSPKESPTTLTDVLILSLETKEQNTLSESSMM